MKHLLIALLLPITAYSEAKPDAKPTAFTFIMPKSACTLIDGKLILPDDWPFGSWEDCAYAVLSAAQQLDAIKDGLTKQLAEEKAKAPVCPIKNSK